MVVQQVVVVVVVVVGVVVAVVAGVVVTWTMMSLMIMMMMVVVLMLIAVLIAHAPVAGCGFVGGAGAESAVRVALAREGVELRWLCCSCDWERRWLRRCIRCQRWWCLVVVVVVEVGVVDGFAIFGSVRCIHHTHPHAHCE